MKKKNAIIVKNTFSGDKTAKELISEMLRRR